MLLFACAIALLMLPTFGACWLLSGSFRRAVIDTAGIVGIIALLIVPGALIGVVWGLLEAHGWI